ncbi:phosphotransferase [Marinobacter sp. 2_MG-2023]|uniref:phosphotransferase n=1 Tax=Marinobacter sp. 2_MG-2023 TaxID=3062679 RepID=UPI0026E47C80|nr:phosphotransferase [Marinobacter sp. 2_MG-2023]MDO6442523.1 phosphotransferase [Marinobacter sp. 2_MG-2023]
MNFIKSFLSTTDLLPNNFSKLSIACISTTRPIYLIFTESDDYPMYVIRKISDDHDLHSSNIHKKIYQLAGNFLPEPVGIYIHEGKKYDVQRGVKGVPWFQLKAKIRSKNAREQLEKRIWKTLREFQHTISQSEYNIIKKIQPHEELKKARLAYLSTGETLSGQLKIILERAIDDLKYSTTCPSIPQHGDFCLNNLIIDTNHITVIDFEDFLITKMPLYDHFSLALSLPSCGNEPAKRANVFSHSSIVTSANALSIHEELIRWHFLHHLLLRLGPWSNSVKRAPYRASLKRILDSFIKQQFINSYEK